MGTQPSASNVLWRGSYWNGVTPTCHLPSNESKFVMSRLSRIIKDGIDVLKTGCDIAKSLRTFILVRVNRIKCSAHGFHHFTDFIEKLFAMCKDDEHVLSRFFASGWIDERLLDVGVVH